MGALLSTSTLPVTPDDGAPRFVHDLAQHLSRWCDVTILAPDAPGCRRRERLGNVEVRRFVYLRPRRLQRLAYRDGMGENLRRSPLTLLQLIPFLISQALAVRALVRRQGIQLVNSHWMIPQGLSAALARGRDPGFAHLVTVHGGDVYALARLPFGGRLARFIVGRSDAVFAVSDNIRAVLDGLLGFESGAAIVPVGVDGELFRRSSHSGEAAARDGEGFLLFVGRLHPIKGVGHLLQAMPEILRRHPGLGLVVIGYGAAEERLRRQARRLEIAPAVRFVGARSHAEIAAYLHASRAVVVPSLVSEKGRTEGMPAVVLEALAAGARLVASDVGGIGGVVRHGHNGWLCRPGDVSDLARTILQALEDPSPSAVAARAAASAEPYEWPAVAARYLETFQQLIGPEVPRRPPGPGPECLRRSAQGLGSGGSRVRNRLQMAPERGGLAAPSGGSVRVLHLVAYYPPERPGGVGVFVSWLHRALLAAGHRSHVVTTGRCTAAGVEGIARRPFGWALRVALWARRAGAYDIVHAQSGEPILALLLIRLFRGQPRIVTTFHVSRSGLRRANEPYSLGGRQFSGRTATLAWKSGIGGLADRLAAHCSDAVVAISHNGRRELRAKLGVGNANVIYYGIPPPADQTVDQGGAGVQPVSLLYVGVPGHRKRVNALPIVLELVRRQLPGATLRIVGFTLENEPQLHDLFRELEQFDFVEALGPMPPEEIDAHYRAAGVLLVPSVYEGLPLVILEAMRSGLPVVATRVSGHPEIVECGRNGFLVGVDRPEQMAKRCVEILASDPLRERLGIGARRTIEERFSNQRMLEAYVSLYRSLAGRRRTG